MVGQVIVSLVMSSVKVDPCVRGSACKDLEQVTCKDLEQVT